MALNYSHRPIFSAHIAEDNLVSPMRILNGGCLVEGVPERNGDGLVRPRHGNREKIEECFEYGRDRARGGGPAESGYKDIIDLLPTDPFGMDISSTVTAITGWLEDLKVDYGGFGRSSVGGASRGEYSLFAGLNLIWNNAIKLQSFPGSVQFDEKVKTDEKGNCGDGKREFGDPFSQYGFGSACNQEEFVGFNNGSNSARVARTEEKADGLTCSFVEDEGASHGALSSGLGYLEMGTKANHDDGGRDLGPAMARYGSGSACDELNIAGFNFGNGSSLMRIEEKAEGSACCCNVGEGASDKAFSFTLGFMETDASENNDVSERDLTPALPRYGSGSASGEEEIATVNNVSGSSYMRQIKQTEGSMCCPDEDEGAPHTALSSALGYLETDTKGNHDDGERGFGDALARHFSSSACEEEDIPDFNNENNSISMMWMEEKAEGSMCGSNGDEEGPHRALSFALGYLGLRDLLSVERVCRSLCSSVRTDSLLWRNIHINQPLNERITDDVLLQLTNRAHGNLQCLSLVECPRVTDDGVRHVLESNPRLTKLNVASCVYMPGNLIFAMLLMDIMQAPNVSLFMQLCVPGCTRLGIEGIMSTIKVFNSHKDSDGIKHLRIGGLYGITHEHFEELMVLLGADNRAQQSSKKPHFYHRGNIYLLCDDDRAIDVETCPRCLKLRLVYDCSAEGCQVKDKSAQACRACILCIPRCVQCGRCIVDNEYEETFCLELLCAGCFKQLLNCEDEQD